MRIQVEAACLGASCSPHLVPSRNMACSIPSILFTQARRRPWGACLGRRAWRGARRLGCRRRHRRWSPAWGWRSGGLGRPAPRIAITVSVATKHQPFRKLGVGTCANKLAKEEEDKSPIVETALVVLRQAQTEQPRVATAHLRRQTLDCLPLLGGRRLGKIGSMRYGCNQLAETLGRYQLKVRLGNRRGGEWAVNHWCVSWHWIDGSRSEGVTAPVRADDILRRMAARQRDSLVLAPAVIP